MGYELRRQLREALGPDITGLQRAVALEIADDANERTRRSAAPLEKLVLWTGAKDASVIRNALKRLAASGWEFRVPIGKGKDGRTLYAVPGTRMTFLVPHFEGVATATPKGEQGLPLEGATATPSKAQGGAGAHSEGAGAHSEGAGAPPSSSDPSYLEEASTVAPIDLKAFGEFWLTYPKSRDKGATLDAWRAEIAAGADPRQIIAAAASYAHEQRDTESRYIKHSANWLREHRYEDRYAPQPNARPALRAVSGGWTAPNRPHPATGAGAPIPTAKDYEEANPF